MSALVLLLAVAQERPEVAVDRVREEGKWMLRATVRAGGKPVEGAVVAFYVRRTFGRLFLGREETIDDGTAAVRFPEGLPGGASGELEVVAEVESPKKHAKALGRAAVPGGSIVSHEEDPFPRALWAPRAPMGLIAAIAILLAGVWITYMFVLIQLVRIRKGAKDAME